MIPVILAGGQGTRLWPLSRQEHPKQFLPLASQDSMFLDTIKRLESMSAMEPPYIVCNEKHRFMVAQQLLEAGIKHQGILLEPCGRNTAPAVALAALQVLKNRREPGDREADPVLLVLPADHLIQDVKAFKKAVYQARSYAAKGYLMTFGIVPDHPETGYGYIRSGNTLDGDARYVAEFVEKPELETAKSYLASGLYFWNSGMFLFKAGSYLTELEKFSPDIYASCQQALAMSQQDDFIRPNEEVFTACPSDSIDYAVMEKTSQAVVMPLNAKWSDLGSWAAIWEQQEKDDSGNVVRGDIAAIDTKNSFIQAEHKLVATAGINNLIIVETKDAVMVAHRDRVQMVKDIVTQLNIGERKEAIFHREQYRSWGKFDCIDIGDRFRVKRITVNPGESLSEHLHHHRAEHWIVVKGTARVKCDKKTFLLSENQSTYIPLGTEHQLSNPGKIKLELIEVQSGAYLEDTDMIRSE